MPTGIFFVAACVILSDERVVAPAAAGAAIVLAGGAVEVDGAAIEPEDLASFFALFSSVFLSEAYQSLTPPCPAQAPRFFSTDVYDPSLHWPVEPAGA
jgi:hypothetical protein